MIHLLSPILSLYLGTYRKFKPLQPHTIKKIAICPAGGIGDCITILPMIRLLKRICPQVEIHIIVNERNYGVLENDTDIHQIHVPRNEDDWLHYRKYNFSIVYMLNWINISAWGIRAWKIGGRNSVRMTPFQGNRYNHFFSYQSEPAIKNVTDIYIDLIADTFGIKITREERANIPYNFTLGNDADNYALGITTSFGNKKYAIINYSVIHERKKWHDEGFRTVAEHILEKFPDMYIIVLYTLQDDEQVHNCFDALNSKSNRIIYAVPNENFLYSAAIVKKSQFLFSVDTSFIHCCSAFGIPVFALYIGEKNNSILWSARNVPFGFAESEDGNDISSISVDEVIPLFGKFLNHMGSL